MHGNSHGEKLLVNSTPTKFLPFSVAVSVHSVFRGESHSPERHSMPARGATTGEEK
jgi:hypothetical protein